jgi:hypothetical protein
MDGQLIGVLGIKSLKNILKGLKNTPLYYKIKPGGTMR